MQDSLTNLQARPHPYVIKTCISCDGSALIQKVSPLQYLEIYICINALKSCLVHSTRTSVMDKYICHLCRTAARCDETHQEGQRSACLAMTQMPRRFNHVIFIAFMAALFSGIKAFFRRQIQRLKMTSSCRRVDKVFNTLSTLRQ